MRILVADDDGISRAILTRMLEQWGHEPIPVSGGSEALAMLQADRSLRIAMLDWMMPGIEGPEICREIRKDGSRPYAHLILVTAKSEREDIVQGLESGADDYVVKPFDLGELRARVGVAVRIVGLYEQLERANKRMEELLQTDHLTGIMNRRAIVEALETELHRQGRQATPLCVAMMDLDHFKLVNDGFGHAAGDAVLIEAAARMKGCCRMYDSVGRLGGEEFMAVLPGLPREAAEAAGERLRGAIGGWGIKFEEREIAATVSVGMAWLAPGMECDADRAMRAADALLYKAKEAGRDRVEFGEIGG